MEKNDLFNDDAIDINKIAESEQAIFEDTKTGTTTKKEDKKEDEEGNKEINGKESNDFTMSFEDLKEEKTSSLDTEDNIEGNTGDKKPGAPAKKDEKSPSSQSALASLALVLQEAGVLPSTFTTEEISKIENIDVLVNALASKTKENEYADLVDEQKEYLEALRTGVPHYQYAEKKSNAQAYKKLTEEAIESNEALQLELIKRSFIIKNIDIETATELAQKIVKDDDSVDKAIRAKDALIKYEEDNLKAEVQKAKENSDKKLKDEQDKIDSLKSKVNENTEVLPGVKINSQTKEKVFNSMVTPVKKNESGQFLNEVMDLYANNADYKMKLHTLHILTKGFTDFSKLKNSEKSQAVKDLEKKLEGNTGTGFGSGRNNTSLENGLTSKQIVNALPSFKK